METRFAYIFWVQCLSLVFCITGQSYAQANPPEDKQASSVVPFSPIPLTTPSWTLTFRDKEIPGIKLGRYFFITMPTTGAKLQYEYKNEIRENYGVESDDYYHRLSEKIGFRSNGWIYNPAFFEFSLDFEPELSQVKEKDISGTTGSRNIFSPDYLLSATFLKLKPYKLHLMANRRELPSWSTYRGGYETRVYEYGADIDLNLQELLQTTSSLRSNLGYRRYDSAINGFYKQDELSDIFNFKLTQRGSKLSTDLDANYSDKLRTTDEIETHTKTFNAFFSNSYLFRQQNRINLDGVWNFRYQDFDNRKTYSFRLSENLNWRHRENLSSLYRFLYYYSDPDKSNLLALDGSLSHLLFENLSTNLGARTSFLNYSAGQQTSVNPYLGLSYTRKIPGGNINLSARGDYLATNRDYDESQSDERTVLNEKHTISSQDALLKNYNVLTDTIIVTSLDGSIQYLEGIDYTIQEVGDYVSIIRSPLGNIDNNQTVLVNYTYIRDSEYDDDVFSQYYGMSLTFFNSITLQLSHSRARQHLRAGNPPTIAINDTVDRASIRNNLRWSDTLFVVANFDRAADVAYQTWQFSQTFNIHAMESLDFAVKGYYGERTYTDSVSGNPLIGDTTRYGGVLTANWRINNNFSFRMEGYGNNIQGDTEDTVNKGLRASLVFTYRIWSAKLSYDLTDQSTLSATDDSSRLRNLIRFDIIRLNW